MLAYLKLLLVELHIIFGFSCNPIIFDLSINPNTIMSNIWYDKCDYKLITPSEYIDLYPEIQECTPCRSSWGANGYSEVWLNPLNDYGVPILGHPLIFTFYL